MLAYALDVEAYGAFAFNLALWLFVFKTAGIGLDVWVTHAIASKPENTTEYAHKALTLRVALLLFALLSFGLVWLLLSHYDEKFIWVFVILGFRQVTENLRELLIGILHGMEEMKLHATAIIPIDILQLVILLFSILLLGIHSIIIISSIILIFSILRVIGLWMNLNPLLKQCEPASTTSNLSFKIISKQALPIGMTSILALIIGKIDVLMLGQMDTLTVVANYTFAYLFLEVIVIAFGALRKALFPRLSNYYNADRQKFYKLLMPSLVITSLIGIVLLLIVTLLANFIIIDLYAEKYTNSRQYLEILAYSIPVSLLATQLGSALISMQQIRTIIIIQIIAVMINVSLNLLLIPEYSGLGAIWATIVSYTFTSSLYAFFVIRGLMSNEIVSN